MIRRGTHAFRRQFDLGGVIRLGGEKAKGEWNQELSYFRLTSSDPNVRDARKLVDEYGEKPTQLHVMLPSDDPGEVFDDAYELWKGSRKENVKGVLLCRGDGIQAERIINEDDPWDREIVQCPCPENCAYALERTPKKLQADGGSACHACGRLRVICYRVSVLEVYEVVTGSINAFQGIRNKLMEIAANEFVGGPGRIMGIPLFLKRVPKKNRFGKVNYPCRLEVPSWKEWQREIDFVGKVAATIAAPMQRVKQIVEGRSEEPRRQLPVPPEPDSMPEEMVPRSLKESEAVIEQPPPAPKAPVPEPDTELDDLMDLLGD